MAASIQSNRKKLVLLTGAGASVAFRKVLSTPFLTTGTERILRAEKDVRGRPLELFDAIKTKLVEVLDGEENINFEHIYQAILDVLALKHFAADRPSPEWRPVLPATHRLHEGLCDGGPQEASTLAATYLDCILKVVRERASSAHDLEYVKSALDKLRGEHSIWSFTLNYDDLLDRCLDKAVTGFVGPQAPRRFDASALFRALADGDDVHCHLHGSIRWGSKHLLIEEHDSAEKAKPNVHFWGSTHSRTGQVFLDSPIVTGFAKTEAVLHMPCGTYVSALAYALQQCDALVIAGYGFLDFHVNRLIGEFFRDREGTPLYIVETGGDWGQRPGDWCRCREIEDYCCDVVNFAPLNARRLDSGWWVIEQRRSTNGHRAAWWLDGFKAFCEDVSAKDLPDLRA